jgi:phospholipase C
MSGAVVRSLGARATLPVALVALLAAGCGSSSHQSASSSTSATAPATTPPSPATTAGSSVATHPCGSTTTAPAYKHVVWIFMENHSYDSVIGSADAPYINSLANECGLATNYHNVTHPSLPNYISATSGLPLSELAPYTSDCDPTGNCTVGGEGIFAQGESWKAYEESMPSDCHRANAGDYAVRHNPATYYTTLSSCSTNDVPYSQLAADLANNALPAFSFITPNLINDMHSGTVADGDSWLTGNLPAILNSAEYRDNATAIFLTWDEGEGGSSDNCATNTTDVGCHVATIVISPSTATGMRSGTLYNHYSLLATAEELLGLSKLGQAASNASMLSAFNL